MHHCIINCVISTAVIKGCNCSDWLLCRGPCFVWPKGLNAAGRCIMCAAGRHNMSAVGRLIVSPIDAVLARGFIYHAFVLRPWIVLRHTRHACHLGWVTKCCRSSSRHLFMILCGHELGAAPLSSLYPAGKHAGYANKAQLAGGFMKACNSRLRQSAATQCRRLAMASVDLYQVTTSG